MIEINQKTPLVAIIPVYFEDHCTPLRETTKGHYYRSLRSFASVLGRDPVVSDLNAEKISLLMHRAIEQGFTPATANQRAKQLGCLWNWAAYRGLLATRPTKFKLPETRTKPPAFTEDEIRRLTLACQSARGWMGPHRASTWWLAFNGLLFDTGEPVRGLLAIKRSWVNPEVTEIEISGEHRKNGEARTIQIAEHLRPLVRELMTAPVDSVLLFERGFQDNQSIYKRYRSLLKAAGIDYVKRWGFRRLIAASVKGGAV